MKKLMMFLLLGASQSVFAGGPIGQWKTIDDETKQAKSIVEVYQKADGTVAGKVLKLLQKPGAVCKKCDGAKKNQPIEGMEILWGLKKEGDKWTSGTILDPKKGKTYRAEIKVIDGGKTLKVTGKVLMFSRSQLWHKL
ncbi:MAG: DUF2147 domain-containing protein [Gammaproteobacteria bacterium]|nr:DUF2147 domain-containing protein [Gammaproteobacteria bacterium]